MDKGRGPNLPEAGSQMGTDSIHEGSRRSSAETEYSDPPDSANLGKGRRRKGADEYASEYQSDFTSTSFLQNGFMRKLLICKFCTVKIGARSDRIKEHLSSKRHHRLKAAVMEQHQGSFQATGLVDGLDSSSNPNPAAASSSSSGNKNGYHGQLHFGAMRESVKQEDASVTMLRGDFSFFGGNQQPPSSTSVSEVRVRSLVKNKDIEITVREGPVPPTPLVNFRTCWPPKSKSFNLPPPPQPVSPPLSYHLKWETHPKIFRNSFIQFQANQQFTDVLLVSGANMIKCHKLVLSACSDYFVNLFKEHAYEIPTTVIFNPRIYPELKALVNFMYNGEAVVPKEGLKPLLKTAEKLGVWGLTPRRIAVGGNDPPDATTTQGEVIDMGRVKKEDAVPNWNLPRPTIHGQVTPTGFAIKIDQNPYNLPTVVPFGGTMGLNPFAEFVKVNAEFDKLNGRRHSFGACAGSGPITATPLWNGSSSFSPKTNITVVKDGGFLAAGSGSGSNDAKLFSPPRKRKHQPESTVTSGMLQNGQDTLGNHDLHQDDSIDLKMYRNILPKVEIEVVQDAPEAYTDHDDGGGGGDQEEMEAIPVLGSTGMEGGYVFQGHFLASGLHEKEEQGGGGGNYKEGSDTASCSSTHTSSDGMEGVGGAGGGGERNSNDEETTVGDHRRRLGR